MARTYLVTGANRGIGLELARQLSERGDRVIGTARDVDAAAALKRVAQRVVRLDAGDEASIRALGESLKGTAIDVLINNAGVSSGLKRVGDLTAAEMHRVFMVNAFSPMLVSAAVMESLRAGERRVIVNITSALGSISGNTGGSSYAYRASKSALNQLTRSKAHELAGEGFICVVVHPGWVRTDMGGEKAPLSPEQSAEAMLAVIDRLRPADTGRFLNYDGAEIAW
ncbi:MAG: SDR family oxidoreductase [Phycisphaeraceae bacterium]|nr:SDR family oxidoreductase [Phycisphaeraceae bacterium]